MKRKIDRLGRIVIPSEMRNQLNIKSGEFADINIKQEEIIISNTDTFTLKEKLERVIEENEANGFVQIDTLKRLLER